MNDLVIYNSSKRITFHYNQKQKSGKLHKGVDLSYSKNEDKNIVYANCFGEVIEVVDKYNNDTKSTGTKTYGNYVLIKHPNGYYSRYAHLKKNSISVIKGEIVNENTPLGIIGDSGKAFGRHLHFEVKKTKVGGRINPEPYLQEFIYTTPSKFEIGKYILLNSKAIRTNHTISNNIVKVKQCKSSVKPKLTSNKPNDKAFFKVGVEVNITEIYEDSVHRIWGKLENCWIVLCNKDGTPQAKMVG